MGGNMPQDPVYFRTEKLYPLHVPIQQNKTNGRSNERFSSLGFEDGLLKFKTQFVTQFYTTVLVKP